MSPFILLLFFCRCNDALFVVVCPVKLNVEQASVVKYCLTVLQDTFLPVKFNNYKCQSNIITQILYYKGGKYM